MKYLKLLALIWLIGCNTIEEEMVMNKQTDIYPEGFNFETTVNSHIKIDVLDNKNIGMKGIPLDVYLLSSEGKQLVMSGQTNSKGSLVVTAPIGNHVDSVVVESSYVGIPQHIAQVPHTSMTFRIGGTPQYQMNGRMDAAISRARTSSN